MIDFKRECGIEVIKDIVEGDSNISRIYGFILYTEKDPYVAKVLRDDDFWNAFDSLSGSNWPIFAVRPLLERRMIINSGGTERFDYMVPTWEDPQANRHILLNFGLKDSSELPLFVVFMWDDNDELNEVTIPIRGDDVDTVYSSIREIIETITKAENAIAPEYKRSVNVFRNVRRELESLKVRHNVIERGKIATRIAEFLAVFCK